MPPDTASPRTTIKVFIDNMNRAYYKSLETGYKNEAVYVFLDRAAWCLDLSEIAPNVVQDVGDETALLLKEVFDRIELPPYKEIPDSPGRPRNPGQFFRWHQHFFGDSSLDFELLCWAHHPEDRGLLIHELNYQIYKAFDAANIQIPFPQRDIHLNSHSMPSE